MPAAQKQIATKRALAKAEEKAAKKQRQDPVLDGVLSAINQAESLPETCRAMLAVAAPSALMTPKDERHELQERTVQWIGEAIASVQAKLQEAVDSAASAVAAADARRSSLDAAAADATASLEARQEAAKAKKAELGEASQAILSHQDEVTTALKAQASGDESLQAAKKQKECLDEALDECVKGLKEGACEPAEAKRHIDRLVPLAKMAGLEESLIMSFPSSGAKRSTERGTFDVMVLDELEVGLQSKAAELAKVLAEGAQGMAERAASVESAKARLAVSEERLRTVSEELCVAQASEKEGASAVAVAAAAVAAADPERALLEKRCEEHKFALQNFEGYHMGCFKLLEEKESEAALAAKKAATVAEVEGAADPATAGA